MGSAARSSGRSVGRGAELATELVRAAPTEGGSVDALVLLAAFLRELRRGSPEPVADAVARIARVPPSLAAVLERADGPAVLADLARRWPDTRAELLVHELDLVARESDERERRGVYTTPGPLARFVVERVDALLRERFELELGLADDATWAEVGPRLGVPVPDGVDPGAGFVRVLEPAVGTGAFLLAVLERVRRTSAEAGLDAERVAQALARRLVARDVSPVACAVARRLVAWEVEDWVGCEVEPDVRVASSLEEEAPPGVTVVLGNPPFAVRSANLGARELVEPYRSVRGEPIVERGALRLEMHLQDDYVKFVRVAERTVERAGTGVVGLVTSTGFLDAPTLRGMRASLAETFRTLELVDLGGSRRRGSGRDESVFGVGPGVGVLVGARTPRGTARVNHARVEGTRRAKLDALDRGDVPRARRARPEPPLFLFVPRTRRAEYDGFVGVKELFLRSCSGIVTAHDRLVVDVADAPLLERAELLADERVSDDEVRERLAVKDNAGWKLGRARERFREDYLRAGGAEPWIVDYAYRPFDRRRLLYHPALVFCDRRPLMGGFGRSSGQEDDVALALCRQVLRPPFAHAFVTDERMDDGFVSNRSRERTHFFPLELRGDDGDRSNLDPEAVARLAPGAAARELLGYAYAVLSSPAYRLRYEDELRYDFPRLPAARDEALFRDLARLGGELVQLHLGRADPPDERAPGAHEARIGAYAPCRRATDTAAAARIERVLSGTVRLAAEVDRVVARHGGFPAAFSC